MGGRSIAHLWRDEQSGLTWLAVAPMIKLESKYKKRQPYPLGWDEQALLFPELAGHLQRMALFAVNTGARQEKICGLKWRWEQRVPELDTPAIQRTVFVLPGSVTKNGEPRVLVLNDVAQAVIGEVRRQHRTYVFTYQDRDKRRNRVGRINNKGWRAARRRAAQRYKEILERECPLGFKKIRVHDLRPALAGGRGEPRGSPGSAWAQDLADDDALQRGRDRKPLECRQLSDEVPRISRAHGASCSE